MTPGQHSKYRSHHETAYTGALGCGYNDNSLRSNWSVIALIHRKKPSGQKRSGRGGNPALFKRGEIGLALVAKAKALRSTQAYPLLGDRVADRFLSRLKTTWMMTVSLISPSLTLDAVSNAISARFTRKFESVDWVDF